MLIEDILSAQFQQYDELSDVYGVYQGLGSDGGKFRFVLEWNEKTLDPKEELYSKYACHELNFFIYKKDQEGDGAFDELRSHQPVYS